MKNLMIFLTSVLLIACVLFWRQVWGIFAGMSVLESLSMIVQFVLHAAVATIIGYAAMILPEYLLPWLKAFRWKRSVKRRTAVERHAVSAPAMPRFARKDQWMMQMLSQMAASRTSLKRKERFGEGARDEPVIRLDL